MTEQAPPPASADGSPLSEPAGTETTPGEAGGGAGSPDVPERQQPAAAPGPYRTAAPGAPAPPAWKPSYAFLLVVSIVTLVADLGSKGWAKGRLDDAKTWTERHI